jgi:succinate dehydrogenase flavin-adding protein (antitoxin of CptAB toxin-antitoxin module)
MKRTPIILAGQVYLHGELNQYLVVTKSNQGDIKFKGPGFTGVHDADIFLKRFGPVDPADLTATEKLELIALLDKPINLLVGWVRRDDEQDDVDADVDSDDDFL